MNSRSSGPHLWSAAIPGMSHPAPFYIVGTKLRAPLVLGKDSTNSASSSDPSTRCFFFFFQRRAQVKRTALDLQQKETQGMFHTNRPAEKLLERREWGGGVQVAVSMVMKLTTLHLTSVSSKQQMCMETVCQALHLPTGKSDSSHFPRPAGAELTLSRPPPSSVALMKSTSCESNSSPQGCTSGPFNTRIDSNDSSYLHFPGD